MTKCIVTKVENLELFSIALQKGKRGKDGDKGSAGIGGVAGKHGVDRAWVAYSGFKWHPWEKVEGKPGAEKIVLKYHNGWFMEGCELDHLKTRRPETDGIQGTTHEEHNLDAQMSATKRNFQFVETENETENAMDEEIGEGNKNTSKIQECLQKLSALRTQKALSAAKVREIDELRAQTEGDFGRMREQLEQSTLVTRAQENYSIQNNFQQMKLAKENSEDDYTNKEATPLFANPIKLCEGMLGGDDESAARTLMLGNSLSKIKTLELYQAAEAFMKVSNSAIFL